MGSRAVGAVGAFDFLVDQMPRVWSADAERILDDGLWTARDSMVALWP